ncbi:MAG: BspA family leucine-rich repeat surface protein [Alphaproteobacteria bacterium]|nr:BspA family leucine-rich repeat surface protein [Alphaproteobacteria bacterium]
MRIDYECFKNLNIQNLFFHIKFLAVNGRKVILDPDCMNMFANSSSIKSVDFSGAGTSNVTDMQGMFRNCKNLISLNLSNFDTKNVPSMLEMFRDCKSLTALDLSSLDTKEVTNMGSMFSTCDHLIFLDLRNFNTANVTGMGCVFYDCSSLKNLDVSAFDTKNVTNMEYMFYDCQSLSSLDLSSFDTQNVKDMSNMFDSCLSLSSIFFDRAMDFNNKETQMSLILDNKRTIVSIEFLNTNRMPHFYKNLKSFFDDDPNSHKVDISNMLENCVSLVLFRCPRILLLSKVFKGEKQIAKNCIHSREF